MKIKEVRTRVAQWSGERRLAIVEEPKLCLLRGFDSLYALARAAITLA